ncbi:MAG: sodium-dependent transporter [Bacillota bacterium]|nr:sodium-dependent transporter [Bacillota bacterium]
MENGRGQWMSSFGFVLAAAGSAVGLGNLWKFPYITGANGGGAFVVTYLLILLFLGVTVMIAEIALGRHTQLNAYGAYKKVKEKWAWVGGMAILTAFLIMSYYSVVGGWVIKYLVDMTTGALSSNDPAALGAAFGGFIGAGASPLIYMLVFMVICFVIVIGGISGGIEKANKILMPLLFLFIIIVAIRSMTLPGAAEGIKWLFAPDFSKFTGAGFLAAMGQVFFSLSLGMGAMITYGSYVDKEADLAKSGWTIPLLDTFVAIMAGLAIIPAVFAFGFEPSQGAGLVFITLPAVFSQMPAGQLFGIIFFLLVLFAAITSAISLVEACVAWLIDEKKMARVKATSLTILGIIIFAIPASMSMGAWSGIHLWMGLGFFDAMDFLTSNIMLPLGGLLLCIFVGWVWGTEKADEEITNGGKLQWSYAPVWNFLIKYVAPLAIAVIFVVGLMPK